MTGYAVIVFAAGLGVGVLITGALESVLLWVLKIGKPSGRVLNTVLSAITLFLAASLGIALLVFFYGVGLLVALDKGYDSGEKFLTAGIVSLVLIPFVVLAARTLFFRVTGLGNFGLSIGYSFVATLLSCGISLVTVLAALSLVL